MCIETGVFTLRFSTTVLQHITAVKCVKGCPKMFLDARLVADVKLQFPGLHAHLTSILSISSCGDIGKSKPVPAQRNCGSNMNNFLVKCIIHPESPNVCEFPFYIELSCVSVNMEVIPSI
jgi:hypothetical protein